MSTLAPNLSDRHHAAAVARATKDARKDAAFGGITAALVGAILGSKVFRFSRGTTLFCGALTGALASYQFNQGFLSTNLARLELEEARLRKEVLQNSSESEESSPSAYVV